MDKRRELGRIAKEIERCEVCKVGKSGLPVPGEGNPDAKIMFVGMAPGRQEAKTGRPFVGRSGKLLTKLLKGINLDREDVYITSPVKYFPERPLTRDDIAHGRMHITEQMEAIGPRIVVLLGSVAIEAMLDEDGIKVVKDHGKTVEKGGRRYLITYHPAAILRFRKYLSGIESDFRKLKRLIESKR